MPNAHMKEFKRAGGRVSPAFVRRVVEKIDAISADYEVAHSCEDQLYKLVLQAIADGNVVDAKNCAREALKSQELSFARYCA